MLYGYTSELEQSQRLLENWIRGSAFYEKYQPEHCGLAAQLICEVADQNRKQM